MQRSTFPCERVLLITPVLMPSRDYVRPHASLTYRFVFLSNLFPDRYLSDSLLQISIRVLSLSFRWPPSALPDTRSPMCISHLPAQSVRPQKNSPRKTKTNKSNKVSCALDIEWFWGKSIPSCSYFPIS